MFSYSKISYLWTFEIMALETKTLITNQVPLFSKEQFVSARIDLICMLAYSMVQVLILENRFRMNWAISVSYLQD